MAALPRQLLQAPVDVGQGGAAVDVGFALAEQVQVGAVQYKNGRHLDGSLPLGRDVREFWRNLSGLSTNFHNCLEFWQLIRHRIAEVSQF